MGSEMCIRDRCRRIAQGLSQGVLPRICQRFCQGPAKGLPSAGPGPPRNSPGLPPRCREQRYPLGRLARNRGVGRGSPQTIDKRATSMLNLSCVSGRGRFAHAHAHALNIPGDRGRRHRGERGTLGQNKPKQTPKQQHEKQTPKPRHKPNQKPRHEKQTSKPRREKQTPKPRHETQTPKPRHKKQTPTPRHEKQTPKQTPKHQSKHQSQDTNLCPGGARHRDGAGGAQWKGFRPPRATNGPQCFRVFMEPLGVSGFRVFVQASGFPLGFLQSFMASWFPLGFVQASGFPLVFLQSFMVSWFQGFP